VEHNHFWIVEITNIPSHLNTYVSGLISFWDIVRHPQKEDFRDKKYWGDAVRVQTPLLGEWVDNPVRLIEVGNILKKP
jgi:hypothetical protein